MLVRRATVADLPLIQRLHGEYPYKTVQRRRQGLDRERLLSFYQAGLQRALEKGQPHWIALEGSEPLGVTSLVPNEWHTSVFGLRMGRVQPWLNISSVRIAGPPLLLEVEDAARISGFEHLTLMVDGQDFPNLHLLEDSGWSMVDVSLKYTLPFPLESPPRQPPIQARDWPIEPAKPEDAMWMRDLAREAHSGTHYLNDTALPRERVQSLFAQWVERCLNGLAWRIWVARDRNGKGVAFVIYLRNEAFAAAVGRRPLILDFILVDPAARGGGVGPWLTEQTLAREAEEGFDYCELRTSAHNIGAVIGYEKIGFTLCATDYTLTKTFRSKYFSFL